MDEQDDHVGDLPQTSGEANGRSRNASVSTALGCFMIYGGILLHLNSPNGRSGKVHLHARSLP